MLGKVFSSSLPYHIGVLAECFGTVSLSVVNQCGISCLLGLGGPPEVVFGVAPPIGMLFMGSGEGCCLLSLGDCLGANVGGMVAVGCSSMGEVLCCETSGGNGGVYPSKRWYEAARSLLSSSGLLYKMGLTSNEEVIMALALLFYSLFF